MATKKEWKQRTKRLGGMLERVSTEALLLMDERDELRDEVNDMAERAREVQENTLKNLRFCDQMTNWFGERSERWAEALGESEDRSLYSLYNAMDQIRAAYHEIGTKYPWEENDV